ncbi:ElyC/SanA/YdcF family protein [Demequina soli]|uniref:ElyC/SanA/YdcF family protein n=1 Tax=Demequina soli TaxID=1638987 RepID=UPI000785AC23|nr:ElyC/SanA/YdcF family protein [Demequina soli]
MIRWGKSIALLAAVAAPVVALVGIPLYVHPAHDEPRAVDAVYVIGPPTDTRMALAEAMIEQGLSDTLVVSLSDDPDERAEMTRAAELCDRPQAYAVYCSQPEPFTTRGEARWMRELIDQHGWQSVGVITTTPHLTRTRVIMGRCWDGDIAYISSGEHLAPWYWAYHYAYQTGAFVKVALEGKTC